MNDKKYDINELPYFDIMQLCRLIDRSQKFEELAAHMQFDNTTAQSLLKESSPTYELLKLWNKHNHKVDELFILLGTIRHYKAMKIIEKYVSENLHRFYPLLPSLEDNNIMHAIPLKPKHASKILNIASPTETKSTLSAQIVMQTAGPLPHISYEELEKATDNWNENFILGKGGFGMVFKGKWKETYVAIKRLNQKEEDSRSQEIYQSITELQCLNTYRHDNILPLYGYSVMGRQPCLIYQFMSGGSLASRIKYRTYLPNRYKLLNWTTRLNISLGVARGLQYLHTAASKTPLVHGDIKPGNILLDENDKPRIGDFGLAREGPQNNYIRIDKVYGTPLYLPHEFRRGNKFSTKVDTYSFGVVLFEIVTALPPKISEFEKEYLKDEIVHRVPESKQDIELEDSHLKKALILKDDRLEGGEYLFNALLKIGLKCVKDKPEDRPDMHQVYKSLEIIGFQEKNNNQKH